MKHLIKIFSLLLVVCLAVENVPKCSSNSKGSSVVNISDGKYKRCYTVINPTGVSGSVPVLFWFHGSGGNAKYCSGG